MCCHASQHSAHAVFAQNAAFVLVSTKSHLEAAAALLLDGGLQLVEGVLAPLLQQRERNLQRACAAVQGCNLRTTSISRVSKLHQHLISMMHSCARSTVNHTLTEHVQQVLAVLRQLALQLSSGGLLLGRLLSLPGGTVKSCCTAAHGADGSWRRRGACCSDQSGAAPPPAAAGCSCTHPRAPDCVMLIGVLLPQ